MRKSPSVAAEKIGVIPDGSEVAVLETTAKEDIVAGIKAPWKRVTYAGNNGWCFGGFLSDENPVKYTAKSDAGCGSFTTAFASRQFKDETLSCSVYLITFKDDGTASLDMYSYSLSGKWKFNDNTLIITAEYESQDEYSYDCVEGGPSAEEETRCISDMQMEHKRKYGKYDFKIPLTFTITHYKGCSFRVSALGIDPSPVRGKERLEYSINNIWDNGAK